jgi:hypothetical protein
MEGDVKAKEAISATGQRPQKNRLEDRKAICFGKPQIDCVAPSPTALK